MNESRTLSFATIADVAVMLREGSVTPVALAEECLSRIERLNPTLNAFITVTADLAHAQARESEKVLRTETGASALLGVPVAVKDFYDTANVRTTAAFRGFENRVPRKDAELVERLREVGAVLVGKTNMHTLGMGTTSLDSDFGAVVNPRSAAHVAGGSSGGSAAAVATGMCFATVDTDAVGSGRLPAAICGVACFKPTYGVLSGVGILAGEPQPDPAIPLLSHPCVTARTADDVALAFAALAGAVGETRTVTRVGIVANYAGTDGVRDNFERVIPDVAAALGVDLVEVRVPFDAASFDVTHIARDRARANARLFAAAEVLLLPTLAAETPTVEEAHRIGDLAVAPANTLFCNYFGLPALTISSGTDRSGLPLGLQIVGPQHSDLAVLCFGRMFQRETGWQYAPPTI